MVISKEVLRICLAYAFVIVLFAGLAGAAGSISVDNSLIKFSLKEGDYATKPFTIKSAEGSAVNLKVVNLRDVSLSEDAPLLSAGDSRTVFILVNASNVNPGAYMGYISINSVDTAINLPVLLEVESRDVFFDSDLEIPPLYAQVAPGRNLIVQIKMFDLTGEGVTPGLSPASVDMEYSIFKSNGALLVSETETLVVNRNSGITKSFNLPKDTEEGNYFVSVVLKYGSSVGVSSAMFSVSSSSQRSIINFSGLTEVWFITLATILIVAVLSMLVFFALIKDRDKFMIALRKYHDVEMKKQEQYLNEQKCVIVKKKGISPSRLKAEVNTKIKNLKIKQKMRMIELKKLKELGDEAAMERKLNEWKNKGYNTLLLESRLNELSGKEMKKIMSRWKKKGYLLR
jgi:hypothetical protein